MPQAEDGAPILKGTGEAYPQAMASREERLVFGRRHPDLGPEEHGKRPKATEPEPPVAGLAISGGGIRSATFGLGVIQGLAKLRVLREFDFLSTVSGGGYVGSFLGGLYCRPAGPGGMPPTPAEVEEGLAAPDTPSAPAPRAIHRSVKWLRENGRYLTPGGSGDAFMAAAMLLRNFFAVHLVMALLWLFLFLVMDRISLAMGVILPARLPGSALGFEPYRSAWLMAVLPAFLAGFLLFGWAYWLVPQARVKGRPYLAWPILGLIPLWIWAIASWQLVPRTGGWAGLGVVLGLASALSIFAAGFASPGMKEAAPQQASSRREMTGFLRFFLITAVAVAAYGLVDSVGWTLWARWFGPAAPEMEWSFSTGFKALFSEKGLVVAAISALVMFREKVEGIFGKEKAAGIWSRITSVAIQLLIGGLAFGLVLVSLGTLSALAHALSFKPFVIGSGEAKLVGNLGYQFLLLGGLGLLILGMSRVIGFLNLSTLGPTYTEALTRAYVGASSPSRREGKSDAQLLEGDDLPWPDYTPWLAGGPLHLINVTLNETTGGKSQVVQKDRKGMGLAVGPAGISVGASHHALWNRADGEAAGILKAEGYSVFGNGGMPFLPEMLTLGQWMGISGAAASTGMGNRTSLFSSLWLGILNVRLGYWWWTGLAIPKGRNSFRTFLEGLMPVHVHLLEEWTAHFPGTHSRHWYLTDGGHFENSGAYELLRRRLPFILLCDDGADGGRELDDVSNLVAKARLDLAAEIRVLDADALGKRFKAGIPAGIGSLDQLRCEQDAALAAFAEIDYLDHQGRVESTGVILILKPTMSPKVPLDVQAYKRVNPAFPQQSTADQFFDEAQFESYRRLGEFIATEVLASKSGQHPSRWF